MIEIKLSKKWCNRTVQALSLPSKPFYAFNDFLEDKIGDGSGYSTSVLAVWLQIFCTMMGSITLMIIYAAAEDVIVWDLTGILVASIPFLIIPLGIIGMLVMNTISDNISISCRCDEE